MSKLRNSLKISGTRRSEQIITVWMWFCCLNWSQIRLIPVYTLHKTIIKISFIYSRSRAETGGTGQGPSLWKGCIKILDGPMKTNWGLELFGLIGRASFFTNRVIENNRIIYWLSWKQFQRLQLLFWKVSVPQYFAPKCKYRISRFQTHPLFWKKEMKRNWDGA